MEKKFTQGPENFTNGHNPIEIVKLIIESHRRFPFSRVRVKFFIFRISLHDIQEIRLTYHVNTKKTHETN
ncbi:hypothetical protein GLOIN_2v1705347, partial [Rhizophagus irregularis DAOM 181602=DAOM 197198]